MSQSAGFLLGTAFFVGFFALYGTIQWVNIRYLKRHVKNWTPEMGVAFVFGLGRDKFLSFDLSPQERSSLKIRIAGDEAAIDDEDLDLFLRQYKRSNLELLIGSSIHLGIIGVIGGLLSAPH